MRASLARTLVTDPELLLLDEPFAAVDEFTRESLNDDLLAMFASAKFSAVFVTHSITEAVYLSQRVIIMSPRPGTIAHEIQIPFSTHVNLNFVTTPNSLSAVDRSLR